MHQRPDIGCPDADREITDYFLANYVMGEPLVVGNRTDPL
jgi:hypothetical protein